MRITLRVVDVSVPADPFVRVELEALGDGLAALDLPGEPDEAVVLLLPLPDGGRDERGRWYTLRRVSPDGRRATIDVVVHEGGIGASWARRVEVGDEIETGRCGSWFHRPDDARWQVLVADAAALPAVARAVEQAPPEVSSRVVVELPSGSGPPPLPPGTDVRVVTAPHGTSRLPEIVRTLVLPDGPGYLYVGGESSAVREARRNLRHERGLAPGQYRTLGYWRRDVEEFMARYQAAPEWFADAWARAEAEGGDEEQVLDAYERTLSDAGVI